MRASVAGLQRGKRFFQFLLAGLPSFILAVPLNILLVEVLSANKLVSYAIVLVFQVTINFFICLFFVFERSKSSSLGRQYFEFVSSILLVRSLDWFVYSVLVEGFGAYYLAVQLLNVLVFSGVKFFLARQVIERRKDSLSFN